MDHRDKVGLFIDYLYPANVEAIAAGLRKPEPSGFSVFPRAFMKFSRLFSNCSQFSQAL